MHPSQRSILIRELGSSSCLHSQQMSRRLSANEGAAASADAAGLGPSLSPRANNTRSFSHSAKTSVLFTIGCRSSSSTSIGHALLPKAERVCGMRHDLLPNAECFRGADSFSKPLRFSAATGPIWNRDVAVRCRSLLSNSSRQKPQGSHSWGKKTRRDVRTCLRHDSISTETELQLINSPCSTTLPNGLGCTNSHFHRNEMLLFHGHLNPKAHLMELDKIPP